MQACNQHSFKINTADSAQPRNRSIVTRPFPCERAGSGHETSAQWIRLWVHTFCWYWFDFDQI